MQYIHPTQTIPISRQSEDLYMLQMAPVYAENTYYKNTGVGSGSTNIKPQNARLNENVDQVKVNKNVSMMNRNPWLTQNQNTRQNTYADIALYDTRNMSLNDQYHIGNTLPDRLTDLKNNKISTPNAWMKDYAVVKNNLEKDNYNLCKGYNDEPTLNCENSGSYNPNLPTSEYNIPSQLDILSPDERLRESQQTSQRPFMTENGQFYEMMKLRNNPEIVERNKRQVKADLAFKKEGELRQPRWNECKQEYRRNEKQKEYFVDSNNGEYHESQMNKYNDRNISQFKDDNIKDIEERIKIINNNAKYNGADDRLEINNKIYSNVKNHQKHDDIDKKSAIDIIGNAITEFFTPHKQKEYKVEQNISSRNPTNGENNVKLGIDTDFCAIKKPIYNKGNHIYMMKNGDMLEVYPDETASRLAPLFINVDPISKREIRTFATKNNEYLYIIQKRDSNDISEVDGNSWENDYVAVQIPFNELSPEFRKKIEINNTNNNDRNGKILNLNYEDYIKMTQWVQDNPDAWYRLKQQTVYEHLRGNQYDKEIGINFEPREVILTPEVVTESRDRIRTKQQMFSHNRINKEPQDFIYSQMVLQPKTKNNYEKPIGVVNNHTSQRNNPISRKFRFE